MVPKHKLQEQLGAAGSLVGPYIVKNWHSIVVMKMKRNIYMFNSNTVVFGNNWHEQTKWPWENFGASPCQCHCSHLVRWNLEFATCCCYGGFGFTEISQTCLKSPLGSPGPRDWALIAAVPQHSKRTLDRNQSQDALEAKTGNVRGDAIEEVQQHTQKKAIVTSHCHRVVESGTTVSKQRHWKRNCFSLSHKTTNHK